MASSNPSNKRTPPDIPEDIYLLPFEEKARYIVELRRRGYTYREIAKMLRVSFRDISMALRMHGRPASSAAVNEELERLRERLDELSENLAEVIRDVGKLEDRVRGAEKVVGTLASVIKDFIDRKIPSRVDELHIKLEGIEKDIRTLHARDGRHSKELAELSDALRKLSSELKGLSGRVSSLEMRQGRLERWIKELMPLYTEYVAKLYSLLLSTLKELGMKPRDEFHEYMVSLSKRIDELLSKV
jgi:chromosome segregation ATPase